MNPKPSKPIIGLLGGIASGKSTVAAAFADLGCAIINADDLAHQALEQSACKEAVIRIFGQAVVHPGGSIDRSKLAQIVFQTPDKLAQLSEILHPWVLENCQSQINDYQSNPKFSAIILDMPLLLEVGWESRCDRLIFVDCDHKNRLKQASKRNISPEILDQRENFQISLDKKAARADNIVINNSDLSSLVRQVTEIFTQLINN